MSIANHSLAGVLVLLAAIPLKAAGLSEFQVEAAVQTWVRQVTADARPDAVIERLEAYVVEDETLAYIGHLAEAGFCLCGADDLVLPVYLYCPQGHYDSTRPDLQFVLREIAERTIRLRAYTRDRSLASMPPDEALTARVRYWGELAAGSVPRAKQDDSRPGKALDQTGISIQAAGPPNRMELDLTCQWSQGSPYNDMCPVLTPPDEHTLVGCTGTATAQIMYYWRWPPSGVGSKTVNYTYRWRGGWDEEPLPTNPAPGQMPWRNRLDWTSNNGGHLRMTGYWDGTVYGAAQGLSQDPAYQTALTNLWNRLQPVTVGQTANFGAATYNWSVLQDQHTDPVDDGDPEVAELCYHAAIAVDTGFGASGSGSDWWRVGAPLAQYLRYAPGAVYTSPRDVDMMIEEIQWLRPFGLGGGPPGHGWVIYGYDKTTGPAPQFKMNMGWGGGSDGWYTLDKVPMNIVTNHNHLTHIAPAGVVKFVGNTATGDGSPGQPYSGIEQALADAPDGAVLIFKAGSDNTFAAAGLTINRPLTLMGVNATVRRK